MGPKFDYLLHTSIRGIADQQIPIVKSTIITSKRTVWSMAIWHHGKYGIYGCGRRSYTILTTAESGVFEAADLSKFTTSHNSVFIMAHCRSLDILQHILMDGWTSSIFRLHFRFRRDIGIPTECRPFLTGNPLLYSFNWIHRYTLPAKAYSMMPSSIRLKDVSSSPFASKSRKKRELLDR